MFVHLPSGFPLLEVAVQRMDSFGLGPPPDTASIGEQTFKAFSLVNDDELDTIRSRHWRNLPYALWLSNGMGLHHRSAVTNRYFSDALSSTAIDDRRLRRWAKPLFYSFIEHFEASNTILLKMAGWLRSFAMTSRAINSSLGVLHNKLDFFNCELGPQKVSSSILASKSLSQWSSTFDLWDGFLDSAYAKAAYGKIFSLPADELRQPSTAAHLMTWSLHDGHLRYPEYLVSLVESLLIPWDRLPPPKELQISIMSFVMNTLGFGDPRFPNIKWKVISSDAERIMVRWLTGRALDVFFDVLKATADDIWIYRQHFWKALYNKNLLEEAWVIVGKDAERYIWINHRKEALKFGRLEGALASQSVLLLRVGTIIFAEWSHSGRLRSQQMDHEPQPPSLYRPRYRAEDLRFHSMLFGQSEGLVHSGSAQGSWQGKASWFLWSNLGIQLKSSEYMP